MSDSKLIKESDIIFISNLNDLQNIIICYVITFLLVIGVISNFFNIIISSREKMIKSTIGFYYIVMSAFNILALITGWLILYPPAAGISTNLVLMSGK